MQPDVVMVELCKSRTNILVNKRFCLQCLCLSHRNIGFNVVFQHLDEATILEEAQNLDMEKSLEILKSHGTVQVCLKAFVISITVEIVTVL